MGAFWPPIRKQSRKGPSWIELRWDWLSTLNSSLLIPVFKYFLCHNRNFSFDTSFNFSKNFNSSLNLHLELNLDSCQDISERQIGFSDCNWSRIYNHLVHKGTLDHLAKPAKWLSCVVSTYLYGAFDSIFSSLVLLIVYLIVFCQLTKF